MSGCRVVIDECVPAALLRGLALRGPEIIAEQVGCEGSLPKGATDLDLLDHCESRQCLLVTADRASIGDHIREHLHQGKHTFGVLLIGPSMSIGEVIDELILICHASEADEWVDRTIYLPLFR